MSHNHNHGSRAAAHLDYALATQIYDAECALHAARRSGVDEWAKAAAEHLHSLLVRAQFVPRAAHTRAAARVLPNRPSEPAAPGDEGEEPPGELLRCVPDAAEPFGSHVPRLYDGRGRPLPLQGPQALVQPKGRGGDRDV
jgi:hypothetical protein